MERTEEKREPADVARLGERIDSWRKTRAKPGPIPEDLWRGAAKLAGKHGINPIACALGLEYYALKKRVDEAGPRVRGPVAPAFVEVAPAPAFVSGCVLELEEPGGGKMTLRASTPLDAVAIAEAFWRCQR